MKTSERLSAAEARVKSAFSIADARAIVSTNHIPSPGSTPAARIAAALETDAIQKAAPEAAARIRDGLKAALTEAENEIEAVTQEAADAIGVASFIVGKADNLPTNIPAHIRAAALTLKGSTGASTIARQLVLASENAEAEIERLRDRWLPRTKHAASAAIHGHAARIYRAAGLERKAMASELMAQRAKLHRNTHIEKASRRRLGDA